MFQPAVWFRFVAFLAVFTGLSYLRMLLVPDADASAWPFFACVGALSLGFIAWSIVNAGKLRGAVIGVLLSLATLVFAAILPPLAVLFVLWVAYHMIRSGHFFRQLLPDACLSLVLYALLFPAPIAYHFGLYELADVPAAAAYALFAVGYALVASRQPLRRSLFRFSTMLISVPLTAVLMGCIEAGVRDMFRRAPDEIDPDADKKARPRGPVPFPVATSGMPVAGEAFALPIGAQPVMPPPGTGAWITVAQTDSTPTPPTDSPMPERAA